MSLLFINNNGNLLPNTAPTIDPGNRAHLYGDGVFETIRIATEWFGSNANHPTT